MARRAPFRGCCAGRRVSDARSGGHRRWPVSGIEVPDTGWGSDGGYRDAARSCGIRYLSGLGGVRRIVGSVVSCGRLTRPRSRFAAIASLFVLAAALRRPRAARTSSFADSERPASESGAAAPPLRAGLPSNGGRGRGWDRSPLGGPWRQRGGRGPTTPKSTLRDHGWCCLVGALQSGQRVRGAATAQLSVRGSLAGSRPELGDLGRSPGSSSSGPFDAVTLAADGVGVGVGDGVALVGVDPVVAGSEAFEDCALGSQILARGAASGIADQDSNPEATTALFGSAIRDSHAGRLNRTVRRLDSAGCDRVPGCFGVCCLGVVKQHTCCRGVLRSPTGGRSRPTSSG